MSEWRRYYLDTGPLLDHLLLAHFARRQRCSLSEVRLEESVSAKVRFLKTTQQRTAYAKLTRRRWLLSTTPGVIVEIYRHICQLRAVDPRQFWEGVEREFGEMGLGEDLVAFTELTAAGLADRGPVDQALVVLAGRERGRCIVTGEHKLRGWCREHEVSCVGVDELVPLMAQY